MARKTLDCRRFPSVAGCSLTLSGEEDELLRAALLHAADVHGEKDSPALREALRRGMTDEGARPMSQMPPGGEAPMH